MQTIFIIGAGRSSSSLISYLLKNAFVEQWKVRVGDISIVLAEQKINKHSCGEAFTFDLNNEDQRKKEIYGADLVISMLPANMHGKVAQDCLEFGKNLVTASYVSEEMQSLHEEAVRKDIIMLNEMGLDPGIDHMSAMKIIDQIKQEGKELVSFKSYCGGLVAPESNDNPWGYKFSWNPRNVVLAGQSTAKYKDNGLLKYIPYNRLFKQTEKINIEGLGIFDGYANRDSLSYRKHYNIESISGMLRGTLRAEGFCKAWNVFVKLGLTDDTYLLEAPDQMTYRELIDSFLPNENLPTEEKLKIFMDKDWDKEVFKKLDWLGIFEDKKIPLKTGTPAQILQELLERKWLLKTHDKDMIVMQHQFVVAHSNSNKRTQVNSTLVVEGEDNSQTAMAKTVGLPMAIAAKLILNKKIQLKGVQIPVMKEIYLPVLHELEQLGIQFKETELSLES